jgi:surface protein
MNELNFPIKYKYTRVTPGDYVATEFDDFSHRYTSSKNRVIDVLVDTSEVTNMEYMFDNCESLKYIPQLDTSKVTNMSYMFHGCDNLITIPQLDTSNVINMRYMFNGCNKLVSIPILDCQNVTYMLGIFDFYNGSSLTDLGGFKDLGKQSVSAISKYFLEEATNLTHQSLMNVIENLYDRKANGLSTLTISFGTKNLNKLTDEEKAIAVNKGWALV